jgi:hypothetical protein
MGVEVKFHVFLTLALDRDMWLGSQSDHFASHVSIDWRLGGPQSRFGHSVEERSFYTCREPNSGYQAHSQPRD